MSLTIKGKIHQQQQKKKQISVKEQNLTIQMHHQNHYMGFLWPILTCNENLVRYYWLIEVVF